MLLLVALAAGSTLATRPAAPATHDCGSGSTMEEEACLGRTFSRVEQQRLTYLAAARKPIAESDAAGPLSASKAPAPKEFESAELKWVAYRDQTCGALYDHWSDGTIRSFMYDSCRIRETRLHTHALWDSWLNDPDATSSTPPEPAVGTEP